MSVLTRGFADDGATRWRSSTTTTLDVERARRARQPAHPRDARAGLEPGDTISIVSGNRNEWFELALACSNSGITFVPVNWHLVGPEIAYIIEDSGSKAVDAGHRFVDEVARRSTTTAPPASSWRSSRAPASGRFGSYDDFVASGSPTSPTTSRSAGRCSTRRARPATRRVCAARCRRWSRARRPRCGTSSAPGSRR